LDKGSKDLRAMQEANVEQVTRCLGTKMAAAGRTSALTCARFLQEMNAYLAVCIQGQVGCHA
jgi:hypothetical protein